MQISLSDLSTNLRRRSQGIEAVAVTYRERTLGFVVSLELFSVLPTEFVSRMPRQDLQTWLFQNHLGWLDGIMDGLILTHKAIDVVAFVHPRYAKLLPLLMGEAKR